MYCGYSLEALTRKSNKYLQYIFLWKNKKNFRLKKGSIKVPDLLHCPFAFSFNIHFLYLEYLIERDAVSVMNCRKKPKKKKKKKKQLVLLSVQFGALESFIIYTPVRKGEEIIITCLGCLLHLLSVRIFRLTMTT